MPELGLCLHIIIHIETALPLIPRLVKEKKTREKFLQVSQGSLITDHLDRRLDVKSILLATGLSCTSGSQKGRATWSKPRSLWRAFWVRILSSHFRLHDCPVTESLNVCSDLNPPHDWAHHQGMTPAPAYHKRRFPLGFPLSLKI